MEEPAGNLDARQGALSDQDFEQQFAAINQRCVNRRERAGQLAALFVESGWTPEHLARRFHQSRAWAEQQLTFGHFQLWSRTGQAPVPQVDEVLFHTCYLRTDQNWSREERFGEMLALLQQEHIDALFNGTSTQPADRNQGAAIVRRFADGKWHDAAAIAKELNLPLDAVKPAVKTISRRMAKVEQGGDGARARYRIFKMDKTITSAELIEKLRPLVRQLVDQTKKAVEHPAYDAPAMIHSLAVAVLKKLDELTQ